jgi:hypothetical protein
MKYLVTFLSGLLSDFWWSACIFFVNHDNRGLLLFFNFTYPFINFIGITNIVGEKETKNKFLLASLLGLGYAIGAAIFNLYFKNVLK